MKVIVCQFVSLLPLESSSRAYAILSDATSHRIESKNMTVKCFGVERFKRTSKHEMKPDCQHVFARVCVSL